MKSRSKLPRNSARVKAGGNAAIKKLVVSLIRMDESLLESEYKRGYKTGYAAALRVVGDYRKAVGDRQKKWARA